MDSVQPTYRETYREDWVAPLLGLTLVVVGGYRVATAATAWQDVAEKLVDFRTPIADKPRLTAELLSLGPRVADDVAEALRSGDPVPLAPEKDRRGLYALQKQVKEDILPELLNGKLLTPETRGQVQKLVKIYGVNPPKRGAFFDELENAIEPMPKNVEQPYYTVVAELPGGIQIRQYERYATASVPMTSDNDFYVLADYMIGGANSEKKTLGMTTPVEIDYLSAPHSVALATRDISAGSARRAHGEKQTISFSLPKKYTADTAPLPRENIELRDNEPLLAAVLEFPALATDTAVKSALLELQAGVAQSSFAEKTDGPFESRLLQFNPPHTVPWRRLNAVMIPVTAKAIVASEKAAEDRAAAEKAAAVQAAMANAADEKAAQERDAFFVAAERAAEERAGLEQKLTSVEEARVQAQAAIKKTFFLNLKKKGKLRKELKELKEDFDKAQVAFEKGGSFSRFLDNALSKQVDEAQTAAKDKAEPIAVEEPETAKTLGDFQQKVIGAQKVEVQAGHQAEVAKEMAPFLNSKKDEEDTPSQQVDEDEMAAKDDTPTKVVRIYGANPTKPDEVGEPEAAVEDASELDGFKQMLTSVQEAKVQAQAAKDKTSFLNFKKKGALRKQLKELKETEDAISQQVDEAQVVSKDETEQGAVGEPESGEALEDLQEKLIGVLQAEVQAKAAKDKTSFLNFKKKGTLRKQLKELKEEENAFSQQVDAARTALATDKPAVTLDSGMLDTVLKMVDGTTEAAETVPFEAEGEDAVGA
jgi:hypothetical protein